MLRVGMSFIRDKSGAKKQVRGFSLIELLIVIAIILIIAAIAILARSRFGIAIAAIIRMIAMTISSSIRENPLTCFFAPDLSLMKLMPTLNIALHGPLLTL